MLKNISWRTRLIVLASLGGVFLVLAFLFVWQTYFADNLMAFVPENTLLYAHFSLPATKQSEGFNKMLELALTRSGLKDFPLTGLKREASLIILPNGSTTESVVLLKIKNRREVTDFFTGQRIPFSFLNSDTVLIGSSSQLFQKNNRLQKITAYKFKIFSSLNLYAKQAMENFLTDDFSAWQIISALTKNQAGCQNCAVYLSAKIQKDGSLTMGENRPNNYRELLPPDHLDLILAGADLSQEFNQWPKSLKNFSVEESDVWQNQDLLQLQNIYLPDSSSTDFFHKLASQKFKFLFKASSNTQINSDLPSDLLSGSFYLELNWPEAQISAPDSQQLETMLATLLASKFPKESQITLSDNTKVIELRQQPGKIKFMAKDNAQEALYPDQSGLLAYKLITTKNQNKLIITNNADWLAWQLPDMSLDYGFASSNLWPDEGLFAYFKQFQSLELVGDLWKLK